MSIWWKKTVAADLNERVGRDRGASRPVRFEALEDRCLLAAGPVVTSIGADNRGLVVLTVDRALNVSTVNSSSVHITTAGADNTFGTNDDVSHAVTVEVDAATRKQITIRTALPADTRYQVRLDSAKITDAINAHLDGEFNGGTPSGDGEAGGDLVFYTKKATTKRIVRFDTVRGVIDVELFEQDKPISTANFLNYANSARYDNTIFHRSVVTPTPFVIQGGGFNADTGFTTVRTDSTIRNEPGIHNTRGTLAYAKVGGDANSATSQWFFNLGDNSSNLDSQNGGFTVFGKITDDAGLAVMDAIAALNRIDASAVNGAFTDLPVVNSVPVPANVKPADTAVVRRISVLMELSASPPDQLAAPSFVFNSSGSAFVTVFDLTGAPISDPTSFVSVRFDGNRVKSITLRDGMPTHGLGIAIGGASRVDSIIDARHVGGDIPFVVSNARIGSISIKGAITGANLNGLNVGGSQFEEDIDGDGLTTDMTAVFTPAGSSPNIHITGALTGDLVARGGVKSLRVDGDTSGVDIVIGANSSIVLADLPRIAFGQLSNVNVTAAGRIFSFTAKQWRDSGGAVDKLRATAIDSLSITGDRATGAPGDLEASITLTGDPIAPLTLGRASIAGMLKNSRINVTGDSGPLSFPGGANSDQINVTGKMGNITGSVLSNVAVIAGQRINLIKVGEWFGGSITAPSIGAITTTGNRTFGVDGAFVADLTLAGGAADAMTLGKTTIAGDLLNSTWTISAGGVSAIKVAGDARDNIFDISGVVTSFNADAVSNTNLFSRNQQIKTISVASWDGGRISGFNGMGAFTTRGNSQSGDAGDLRVDVLASRLNSLKVKGNLISSNLQLTATPTANDNRRTLESMSVGGRIENTTVRSRGNIGNISAAQLINSSIYAAVTTTTTGFPTDASQVDLLRTIHSVKIRPARDAAFATSNSYIVTGRLDSADLGQILETNSGVPFGVAARSIGVLKYRADTTAVVFIGDLGDTVPAPFGDFQVRLNFADPTPSAQSIIA